MTHDTLRTQAERYSTIRNVLGLLAVALLGSPMLGTMQNMNLALALTGIGFALALGAAHCASVAKQRRREMQLLEANRLTTDRS